MPTFRSAFVSRYSLDTYEDVINTYEWFSRCSEHVFSDMDNLELSPSISFSTNQIDYQCYSIEEFKEHAFGLDIKPNEIFISVKTTDPYSELATFYARDDKISITSDNKMYLVSIKEALDIEHSELIEEGKSGTEENQPINSTETNNNLKEEPLNIKDSSNILLNVNSQKERKEPWYSQLLWKIVIPIVVFVIGAIIVWKLGFS